ncbi:hypothetical protein V6N12_010484 [Hibiscus sabdariffa]|uniref:Uncharacterized protein n=1 Tax=Hibiscus sabdariffa TaxID=183260 RepID=A0ABR2EK70_9ROSI
MQQPGNLRVAMDMARALERKQKASSKFSSRTNLNWPTSQNIGNNPTIPTAKSFNAKGGGQLVKPVGNNNKVVPDYGGERDNNEMDDLEISLHAINGTRNSPTMQLIAKLIDDEICCKQQGDSMARATSRGSFTT